MIRQFKIIVEKHPDGYVAYPLGLNGVVVAEGDAYEEALMDDQSAMAFHVETFGVEAIVSIPPVFKPSLLRPVLEVNNAREHTFVDRMSYRRYCVLVANVGHG